MRIAITGASGFIGSELIAELSNKDVEITALTRGRTDDRASSVCKWLETDYSAENLANVLCGIECVIHLAGVRGMEEDTEVFAANLEMTENLLSAMLIAGVKHIVFASSVAVYNGKEPMPWKEEYTLKGYRAYGDSKADCESSIIRCADGNGITYGIARIAQVLGEGERRHGMMNVFLDTARAHGTLKVMGKSVLKRQYIYVKDLVKVLAIMATDGVANEKNLVLNVGMPQAYSNLEIAKMVNEVYGNPNPIDYDDSYPETGRGFYMDISRLKDELNFEPLDMPKSLKDYRNTSCKRSGKLLEITDS